MFEDKIEKYLQEITTHQLFLKSVSLFLNFNSYRKLMIKRTLELILKDLELPIRRDQEKILALVQELEVRIKLMQQDQQKAKRTENEGAHLDKKIKIDLNKINREHVDLNKLKKMATSNESQL